MENREYKIEGETPDKKKKAQYLIDLAQDNVDGKITYAEIEELLYQKYANETPEEI